MFPSKLCFIISGLIACVLGPSARADVVPEGQRYIPVTHVLQGTAKAAGRTLLLVTVNGRNRAQCDTLAVTGDGPIAVPSGYMNRTFLVALTAAQLPEMEAAKQASAGLTDDTKSSPLRAFFERDDVAASDVLPFRALVATGSEAQSQAIVWTLAEVGPKALTVSALATNLDASGAPIRAGAFPWIPAVLGALLALALAAWLVRKKRV